MREYIRHPSEIPIEFTVIDKQDGEVRSLHNISRGGLSFTSSKPVAVGTLITVHIPGRNFEAHSRVAWCRKRDLIYDVGVEFINSDDAYTMRMVEQVCHIEQYRRQVLQLEGRDISGAEAAQEWIARFAKTFPNPEV